MPTYLHLVRHAQGFHNLSVINQQITDPELTPLGKQQCAELQKLFPFHDKVTHLVASPMRRTVYTCLLSFEPASKAGKVIIAFPEIQEVSGLPCDTGSSQKRLEAEFEPSQVDFSRLTPDWNDKSPNTPWAPVISKLEARAKKARIWLRSLGAEVTDGDAHIVAVTHGGFLHLLTQDWDGMDPTRGTGWENTEYRTYEFVDPSGADPEARLQETKASWRSRRGSAKGLTETEQQQLRIALQRSMQEFLDQEQEARKAHDSQ
ncbi:phosphoglycerate mutase [Thozetella sp. PMI_491]|nr:phosphoglycerate mutase [Thozetella sp. PMI_491]